MKPKGRMYICERFSKREVKESKGSQKTTQRQSFSGEGGTRKKHQAVEISKQVTRETKQDLISLEAKGFKTGSVRKGRSDIKRRKGTSNCTFSSKTRNAKSWQTARGEENVGAKNDAEGKRRIDSIAMGPKSGGVWAAHKGGHHEAPNTSEQRFDRKTTKRGVSKKGNK